MTLRARYCRTRAPIAMIAAYAIALQMLLSVAVAGQHAGLAAIAPDLAAAICLGSGNANTDDPGQPPVRQVPCVLCAMAGAHAAPAAAEFELRFGDFGAAIAIVFAPAAGAPHVTPRLSQGPPLNA